MPTADLVAIWITPADRTRLRGLRDKLNAETGRHNATYGEALHRLLDEAEVKAP
jgi:hypothetical protein